LSSSVAVGVIGNYNTPVTFTLSGTLPSGVTAAFSPATLTGAGSVSINFTATAKAIPGTYPLTVTATSGSITQTGSLTLTVIYAPNFTISVNPTTLSLPPDTNPTATITVAFVGGLTGSVSLSGGNLPSGVQANFSPSSLNAPGGTIVANFFAQSSTPAGTYTIEMVGTNGTITNSAPLTVVIPGATLTPASTAVSVAPGASVTDAIAITGAIGNMSFSVTGLPTGVSASFNPTSSETSTVLTLTATSTATPTTTPITVTVTGNNGTQSPSATIALTITGAPTGSFKLTPSASTLSVAAGSSAADTIAITDVSPFSGSVNLAVSGLPTGVTGTFGTNPATASSVLTLTAAGTAAATASPVTVTVTGTNSSASPTTATATIALTVTGTSCATTNPIVPYIEVGGVWNSTPENTVTVTSGTKVSLGPWPASGGTWSWTGPSGFTSASREIDNIALPGATNTYTATYTVGGCAYTQAFTITVGSPVNPIVPYISINGVWNPTSESTVTVPSGTNVSLGPWPASGGAWAWTGPNGFTSTSREIDNIALSSGVNTYTATYTVGGVSYTQAFVVTVGTSNLIVPYIAVNGVWNTTPENTVTVPTATTSVSLGPWPASGGAWSWTGPNGFTSTSREIDNIALSAGANTYTATYTISGTSYTETFTVTVGGCSTTNPIVPYIEVNGAWITPSSSAATVSSTTTPISLGPWPASGGAWSWAGPNGYTATAREIDNIPLTAGTDVYTATYVTGGCSYTQAFTITVN
jgi:hypothetical protein